MIHLNDIALAFGGQPLLQGLSWHIKPQKRIGLIGPNGAGKSTLLRIIAGEQEVDEGRVSMATDTTIGYLTQDVQEMDIARTVLAESLQAFGEVLALEAEQERITAQLADVNAPTERLLRRLETVQTALAAHESHRIQDHTERVLMGLGFTADDLHRPLQTFSGGWRMRVALAKLLLRAPQLLLLDEPTNHLDIESIAWLEMYLKSYEGTVVIVSHDRYFLDRMVTTTAELYDGKIVEYAGNYSFYLNERQERRALQQAAYVNQQKWIKDAERFIERFRYKNTKARQVQSRIKMLDKLERINPPPPEQATIRFRFPAPSRSGRVVLELSAFSKTYPTPDGESNVVFEEARPVQIERGQKIALIGKNGAGKSTLARILLGTEPFSGTRTLGYQVELTHFAQHQAESLNPKNTILDELRAHARGQDDTQIRSILGAFLFTGDDVFKPIKVLSGGEKSRVALARTLLVPANCLILDEPTNHLDMQSIGVLIEALKQFTGTFIVVSHDRHFLDQIANAVWYVADGQVQTYPGAYSEWYVHQQEQSESTAPESPKAVAVSSATTALPSGKKTKEQKRREAEERQKQRAALKARVQAGELPEWILLNPKQLRAKLDKLEHQITETETQKTATETQLADPAFYQDAAQSAEMTRRYQELETQLEKLYATWTAIGQHLETL